MTTVNQIKHPDRVPEARAVRLSAHIMFVACEHRGRKRGAQPQGAARDALHRPRRRAAHFRRGEYLSTSFHGFCVIDILGQSKTAVESSRIAGDTSSDISERLTFVRAPRRFCSRRRCTRTAAPASPSSRSCRARASSPESRWTRASSPWAEPTARPPPRQAFLTFSTLVLRFHSSRCRAFPCPMQLGPVFYKVRLQ